jgi:hypothetical protein
MVVLVTKKVGVWAKHLKTGLPDGIPILNPKSLYLGIFGRALKCKTLGYFMNILLRFGIFYGY